MFLSVGDRPSYNTWLKVLAKKPGNACPFTRQKVTRRDLVKLTPENVEKYKPLIKNDSSMMGGPALPSPVSAADNAVTAE